MPGTLAATIGTRRLAMPQVKSGVPRPWPTPSARQIASQSAGVGYKAMFSVASHRMSRRLTEHLVGNVNHKVLIKDSPPAPPTSGSLFEPMPTGQGVDGGMRERLSSGDLQKVQQQVDEKPR